MSKLYTMYFDVSGVAEIQVNAESLNEAMAKGLEEICGEFNYDLNSLEDVAAEMTYYECDDEEEEED